MTIVAAIRWLVAGLFMADLLGLVVLARLRGKNPFAADGDGEARDEARTADGDRVRYAVCEYEFRG